MILYLYINCDTQHTIIIFLIFYYGYLLIIKVNTIVSIFKIVRVMYYSTYVLAIICYQVSFDVEPVEL